MILTENLLVVVWFYSCPCLFLFVITLHNFTETAEKRKRGQNFVAEEKDKLVKLLVLHKDTILNKKTDGSTNEAKNNAWISVTNAFNSSGTIYRSKDSLMKLWEKMKTESKLYYQASKRNSTGTGGGPSQVKIDPILEQVCALLGRACTGIMGVQDSDSFLTIEAENSQSKTIIIDELIVNNDESEKECICEEEQNVIHKIILDDKEFKSGEMSRHNKQNKENVTPCTSLENVNIIKTPLWSRRRPQLSNTNERTEAVSTLCTSFQNVNKKKEDIEELKRHLLQDEIEFKKKLYDIQLKTAVTELEIKTEILNQVKGGALNLQSLFGVPRSTDQ